MRSQAPSIAKQHVASETEFVELAERQRVKAATLNEAKKELAALQAQRAKAEEAVRQLSTRLHAQRAQNDAMNHAMSLLKVENAKLRLAISSPGQQEASRWAAGPTIVPNYSGASLSNHITSASTSQHGRGNTSAVSEHEIHEDTAQGFLDKVHHYHYSTPCYDSEDVDANHVCILFRSFAGESATTPP